MKLEIKIANSFKEKLLGLMFQKEIKYGLLIPNCKSIHTFNMKCNIDVLLLNSNYQVLMINRNVCKNKIINFSCQEKKPFILELPANASKNIKVSDYIDLNNFYI